MKAILIARVSTEEQKEAGNSLPAQVARLEAYCQRKGFTVMKICSFDESAYTSQRTEFDSIINLILAQKEKIVVCCDKVDRLSRNVFDKRISLLYDKALKDEIELHFASDGQIITSNISATEKFAFNMSLGLAKYFSDAISDNVKRAIEQKLRKGEWLARAPFGYIYVPSQTGGPREIILEPYNAAIVAKVFQLYATGAHSLQTLCDKVLKDHGLKWSEGFLHSLLDNPFYYGVMLCKGNLYPHKYPPIITKTLYDQVKHVKASYQKKKYKYAGQPYMYRGLIRCADCGLAITPEKHKGHVYYHCTQFNGKHGAKWLREEIITEQLGAVFKRFQMPQEILMQVNETLNELHLNKMEFQTKQFDQLTKEQKQVTSMIDNLYLDKLKGRITESQYDRFYTQFREQLDDVSIRLALLQEAEDNYYITVKHILDLTNRAYEFFIGSEVEQKRMLLKLLLSNLRLSDDKLLYDVQKPYDLIANCSDYKLWCAQKESNL